MIWWYRFTFEQHCRLDIFIQRNSGRSETFCANVGKLVRQRIANPSSVQNVLTRNRSQSSGANDVKNSPPELVEQLLPRIYLWR
uniref:Uncharacterized protein n=1 Tax=Candidatus Kentrum sp. TC TaxID=2126339 RepID=A0A450ZCS6_9GAMM|nr:MAG: hypothetical protein BECKTC1821D_GA0114238_11356 [Candidatus Kentron sp. TC]